MNFGVPHEDFRAGDALSRLAYGRGDGALFKTGSISGVRTLAGYADTSSHGRVRFVIALKSNDGAMRFRLLNAIQSGL
jgi:D-alanyl-D-alanine carboxypeptidase/D-alanyl-D-alanine-endopeptidase (penicillin-binding protein 4)